jgi:hypothetical protein
VTDRGSADDGSISDIPWASVFDPAINVRALGEIQARGFKAATELVDRFVRMSDRDGATEPNTEPAPAATTDQQGETRSATPRPDADRLLASWKGIIGQLTQSLRAVPSPADAGSAAFDLMNDNSTGRIALEATQPGAVSTEVWLHNGGPTDLGKVWLRCSDLLAHDGTVIPAQMVRFEPDTVPMPPRCSRGVTVEVDVADELPPGCYRGTLLADGHPDVWLPIALTIKPQVS